MGIWIQLNQDWKAYEGGTIDLWTLNCRFKQMATARRGWAAHVDRLVSVVWKSPDSSKPKKKPTDRIASTVAALSLLRPAKKKKKKRRRKPKPKKDESSAEVRARLLAAQRKKPTKTQHLITEFFDNKP